MPEFPVAQSIPLRNAPLELVVCQMRFPPLLPLESTEPPIQFGKRIRDRYPLTRTQRRAGKSGDFETATSAVWTFEDKESAWTVTLSSDFLSLETPHYTSRAEFLGRFVEAARVLNDLYQVPLCERLGVRYLDRIAGHQDLPPDWLTKVPQTLLPGLCLRDLGERCSTNSEIRFHGIGGTALALRVAFVEQGFSGADATELLLDFDSYTVERTEFDHTERIVNELATLCYNSFRWAVGDLLPFFQ